MAPLTAPAYITDALTRVARAPAMCSTVDVCALVDSLFVAAGRWTQLSRAARRIDEQHVAACEGAKRVVQIELELNPGHLGQDQLIEVVRIRQGQVPRAERRGLCVDLPLSQPSV